jgi:hypothetical protein
LATFGFERRRGFEMAFLGICWWQVEGIRRKAVVRP